MTKRRVLIDALPFRIGRIPDLGLTIPSKNVSKQHAEIFDNAGTLWIRDLGSVNGTIVNGDLISAARQLQPGDVVRIANFEMRVGLEDMREMIPKSGTVALTEEQRKQLEIGLREIQELLQQRAVVPYFQPIVEMRHRRPVAFEILGRGNYKGLPVRPMDLFRVADGWGLQVPLSELFRCEGIRIGQTLPGNPNLFVNTHPSELESGRLLDSLRQLRAEHPAAVITLEIHEGAITDLTAMKAMRDELKAMRVGLAYDDFGAEKGQGRLVEIGEVPPDCLKFDIALIRDIDRAPGHKRQMLGHLVRMAADLRITTLAEGVETDAEHSELVKLGFEWAQGYLYGKPVPANELIAKMS
jgi:EAL domain-containing protein (putative c-di-GMP-specific phosphodiesterase class I)